jgi:hypothetical protein
VSDRPSAAARLENPAAVLSRSDLAELGWQRRAIDSLFRACPTIVLDGYARPVILVRDYLAELEQRTYRGDRVRPT